MLKNMLTYLAIVFSILMFIEAEQKWHTSQIALTKLYGLQNDHFNSMDKYLDLEIKRLEELKDHVTAVYEWHDHNITNSVPLHNHMDVAKLMKLMYHNFLKIKDLIINKLSTEALKEIDEHRNVNDIDILLAHAAIRRLQLFYAIPASDMSAGRFNNKIIGDQMNACECYVMAKYCSERNDIYGVIDWAVEAYYKWKSAGQPRCVDPEILNFYIIFTSVYTGFDFINLMYTNQSINLQDDTDKFSWYYHIIKNELFELDKERALDVIEIYHRLKKRRFVQEFRHLCKHGVSQTITAKHLRCRYQTKNSVYRIIMPFKEEDINGDPFIKIYHDVLYENEISKMKAMASLNMDEAKILNNISILFVEETRSCQMYSITPNDTIKYFGALNNRIECFTGFTTKTAEPYHIVNYGLGGHYSPHYDSFAKISENMKYGNRFVTVLFYLSDVQNDGYTSFPKLNFISHIEKGAALVWHNLNMSNGKINNLTLHGSCPILKGNKWIMTRLLYEEGQYLPYDWKKNIS